MLLPHCPDVVAGLRTPTHEDPWRVLTSGCFAGWLCGVEGKSYGEYPTIAPFLSSPLVRVVGFCPEQYALGTPRTTPDIHGGDGRAVLAGEARVFDEHGADLTDALMEGARAMVRVALERRVDFALLMDVSALCGSQVISLGSRFVPERKHQRGVGLATAMLLEAGVHVVSQRDPRTLGLLRARIEPGYEVAPDAVDHHESPWVRANLPLRTG